MGGRKEEVDGVGSGGGEKGGGVVDTYVQHLVVPELLPLLLVLQPVASAQVVASPTVP